MEHIEYKCVKFRPWVGTNYKKGFQGKKILILGDSHYCETSANRNQICNERWVENGGKCSYNCMNKDCYSMTERLIEGEYLEFRSGRKKSEGYLQTILTFEKNLFGYTPSPQESINFWNSVIFYNYKQHSQPKPGEERNTSHEEKQEYRMAFEEILQEYKPKYIVVWSKTLFTKDWLPDGAKDVPDYTLTVEKDGNIYDAPVRTFITSDGTEITAIIIQHPCCRFGKDQTKWHSLLKAFLKLDD